MVDLRALKSTDINAGEASTMWRRQSVGYVLDAVLQGRTNWLTRLTADARGDLRNVPNCYAINAEKWQMSQILIKTQLIKTGLIETCKTDENEGWSKRSNWSVWVHLLFRTHSIWLQYATASGRGEMFVVFVRIWPHITPIDLTISKRPSTANYWELWLTRFR